MSANPSNFRFTKDSIPPESLNGKVALVSGGNTGIGLITVLSLATAGAQVFMASRTRSKALEAISSIEDTEVRKRVEFVELDLASLKSVRKAAEDVKGRTDRLDILVCNAGIMMVPYELTEDGVEIQMASNHLGHFALFQLLLPLLQKTADQTKDVRVITVSSVAHNGIVVHPSAIKFRTIEDFNYKWGTDRLSFGTVRRYSYSKLANILFAKEVERRFGSSGIHAIPTHPGIVRSDLWNNLASGHALYWRYLVSPVLERIYTEPEDGASSSLYAATSPEVAEKKLWGKYINPGGTVGRTQWAANDERLARELWELSDRVVKEKLAI